MAELISPGSVGGVPIICQTVNVNMASATAQPFSDIFCKHSQQDPLLTAKCPVPLLVLAVAVCNCKHSSCSCCVASDDAKRCSES